MNANAPRGKFKFVEINFKMWHATGTARLGRAKPIKPAELRDGLYTKPVALLDVEQLWVGRREVWTSTHGSATRYHVMLDGGVAACRRSQPNSWRNRSVILINEDSLIPIAEVPANMCCLRNGCRQLFEAMIQ